MSRTRAAGGALLYLAGIALVGAAGVGAFYLWHDQQAALAHSRDVQATAVERGPRVEVVAADAGPTKREVSLLGEARPFATVTLYSKASGYLKAIPVDKGDKVKEGQVIAEIESPETDAQYTSAVADLDNKRRLAQRARDLVARQYVSVQQAETTATDERMAAARVAQLATLKAYQIMRAPFAGTVTARFVDPGTLVQNAENNQTSAQPILTLSDTTKLRIYAYVEQKDAPFIHVGDVARIADAASPERFVRAAITRTAGQLDPSTRTLLVEIELDNGEGLILAGSFIRVTIEVPVQSYPRIPAAALVMRGTAPFVAVLDEGDQVRFRPIKIAATDGAQVAVGSGVEVGERVAINLPSSVAEGSRIQPLAAKTAR